MAPSFSVNEVLKAHQKGDYLVTPEARISRAKRRKLAKGNSSVRDALKPTYRHTIHFSAGYFREAPDSDGQLIKGTLTSHIAFEDKATAKQVKGWGGRVIGDMVQQVLAAKPELAGCEICSIMLLRFECERV